MYLIMCFNCREQHLGSAISFKQIFRIDKHDIKTNKDLCGTTKHFKNKYCDPTNKHLYLNVQIIEQVFHNCNNGCNIEDLLWESEKH